MNTDIEKGFRKQTEIYSDNYEKYGYSVLSMLMPSDRRNIRYYELVKNFECFQDRNYSNSFTLCDAGCGFGDINDYLRKLGIQNYSYIGLDVVDRFLEEGRRRYGADNIRYIHRNFIEDSMADLEFDYAISSQTFTIPYTEERQNYDIIFQSINRLFERSRKGVSFNFFTDQGDYQRENTAYHNPARLLEFAYTLSNRVILDNGCFPYECTLTILKDTGREQNGMVFDSFMRIHREEFKSGLFNIKKKHFQ